MKNETVGTWMSTSVITGTPDMKLPDADMLMAKSLIRRLPIVDPENGRLVGIVTVSDIRGAAPSEATSLSVWEINYLINRLETKQFMTAPVTTVTAETSIIEAARIMLEQHIGGIPVIDDQENLIGIITESDIFRLIVKQASA